jgi:Acetyltransferase (GNAT) domain
VTDDLSVEVVRTAAGLERLAPEWAAIPWEREEAELDYLLARVEARPEAVAPFAILVRRGGEPAAALAARIENRRLSTAFGPRTVYAPRVRILQVVDGGIVAPDPGAIPRLVQALQAALAAGDADAAAIPPLPLDSPLYAALASAGGPLDRQRFISPWQRRLLALPASFEEYLETRSGKVRFGIRYDAKKLLAALGDELSVAILDAPGDCERLVAGLERVARLTYQRSIGAGFADTPEQRRLAEVGLAHGWLRAYVLYRNETPIAFWLCAVHGETILLKTTGFDPEYLRLRVGVYLLMRVIEHACADPALRVLDFGPGDADYKRYFSSESRPERNLVLFAPSLRARRVNAARTGILGAASAARWLSDRASLTERLKARRRRSLRG